MEEDIKILEAFKNQTFLYGRLAITQEAHKSISIAIENLIKGYREKEESEKYLYDAYQDAGKKMFEYAEKCDELEKENQSYRDYLGEPPCYDNAKYIPKSKVKEKIEELRKEPLKIKQNDKYYFTTDAYNKIIIQVLQELLGGEE